MIFNSITKVVYIFFSYANTSTPLALHEILHALYESNVAVSRLSLFKEIERSDLGSQT